MKDWSKERWRKLYLREALEQRLWSVMARGLRDYLIRLAEDDGALIRDAEDPVEALLLALGAESAEAELVRVALLLLLRDGFLKRGATSIFVANLTRAQSWEARPAAGARETVSEHNAAKSSTERVRRHRERLRQAATEAARNPSVSGETISPVLNATTGVPVAVSNTTSASVPSSRGSRDHNLSEELLDLQEDNQTVTHSSSRTAVTSSATVGVSSGNATAVTEEKVDNEQLQVSADSGVETFVTVAERAAMVLDTPALAATVRPECWPEVCAVAVAFARAAGVSEQRLGRYGRDPGVRAIVELYAAGYTQAELEQVARVVPTQSWWTAQGKRLGLSSLTIEVVRRNLPSPRAPSPQVAKVLEYVRQRREAG